MALERSSVFIRGSPRQFFVNCSLAPGDGGLRVRQEHISELAGYKRTTSTDVDNWGSTARAQIEACRRCICTLGRLPPGMPNSPQIDVFLSINKVRAVLKLGVAEIPLNN